MSNEKVQFADLFAGLGCFHLAVAQLGGECVFASEIDEGLRDLYEANFELRPEGDIREIDPNDIPDHNLLCAGFPCQPFSKAGAQIGLDDLDRGTLIYDIFEILRVKSPEFVILENIAHFVNHDEGKTHTKMQAKLKALDYDVKVGKLSPHQFGVPQIRERMYLVARKKLGSLDNFKFPEPETTASELSIKTILDKNPTEARQLSDSVKECIDLWQEFLDLFPKDEELPGTPLWTMEFGATYPYNCDSLHKVDLKKLQNEKGSFGVSLKGLTLEEILQWVPSHARSVEKTFPDWKKNYIRNNREFYQKHKSWLNNWLPKIQKFPSSYQKLEWHCKGEPRNIWDYVIRFRASGVRVKRPTTSPSLVAMTTVQVPIIGWEKRYMTIRECMRLQSIDGLNELPSDSSRATRALGNAVNVKVVMLILQNLLGTSRSNAARI